ncbi:hypothetical protein GCK72_015448 [Caenorhabditis remanei]|uniref:Serpentine receptor class gamma n=1 Tax=Caenorhabditis remanei TaxID=31234 RepID=A0A6A5GU37_CAERE|nr:hypothetical protein GCK72_015448 [Caenorhabditis remanei]KAF1758988.1 hypothetical protein GCK72_015448 [Caenorhabditis remanei]
MAEFNDNPPATEWNLQNMHHIWKILFPILLALVIVVTVFGTRTILATVPYYTFNEALDMYTIKSDSNILPAYYNVIYFMAFSVSLSVFLNVISVIRLKIIQHKISTVERNLLLVTIFSSIIQCFAAGNTFVLQLDPTRTTLAGQAAQVILPFASDFLTISQPYVLIFLSSKVRSGFIRMYLKRYAKQFNGMAFTKTNEFGKKVFRHVAEVEHDVGFSSEANRQMSMLRCSLGFTLEDVLEKAETVAVGLENWKCAKQIEKPDSARRELSEKYPQAWVPCSDPFIHRWIALQAINHMKIRLDTMTETMILVGQNPRSEDVSQWEYHKEHDDGEKHTADTTRLDGVCWKKKLGFWGFSEAYYSSSSDSESTETSESSESSESESNDFSDAVSSSSSEVMGSSTIGSAVSSSAPSLSVEFKEKSSSRRSSGNFTLELRKVMLRRAQINGMNDSTGI